MRCLDRASLLAGRQLLLGTLFDRLARVHADRPLVAEVGDSVGDEAMTLTYSSAAERVARFAGGIRARAAAGDRVVIATPNSYDSLLLCLAASRAGAIGVPVNPRLTPAELDHVVTDSSAGLVVRDAAEVDGAAVESAPFDPGDTAAIFYTSGTTGRPKASPLTHRGLLGQVTWAASWPTSLRRDEAVVGLPVAHIMGFAVLLGLACAGIPVAFLPRFRPVVALDQMEQRRATIFVGVPAMYRMLLEAGAAERDLRSVRLWVSGADVMPADLARRFQRMGSTFTFPGTARSVGDAAFIEGYGLVEAGGAVATTFVPPNLPFAFPTARVLGVPLPPYRLRVADDHGRPIRGPGTGELWVKGPGTPGGGWLPTGDLVRRSPLGLLFFEGRRKDVIKRGGYSVYAVEVERALEEHPGVVEAAVVGMPDEQWGERVVAVVRLVDGTSVTAADVIAFARGRLADYKVPDEVEFVDDFPRTGTDKVSRSAVRASLQASVPDSRTDGG